MKTLITAWFGAALCALALAAHPGANYPNEREFTNLTKGHWRLRLLACPAPGGMEVFSGEARVAQLVAPGMELTLPTEQGLLMRYRTLDALCFLLVDHRGEDGGVVFRVGRRLELSALGGSPVVLERVLDLRQLRLGNLDLLAPEWPQP